MVFLFDSTLTCTLIDYKLFEKGIFDSYDFVAKYFS
ncbi:hypothetical protein ECH_0589 [Ehrlichia chaffeensis str. Arkansas]|uniref:Uncharacterized protein n=1 Tax=Ehrlichia chaffeensis (strain ATCC CRL-10679 / Arkansas) TaxID=205920 RepID=Q2GGN3_EHRCR|nr:hypothetical protein ECH_0589 [Ehrlichia chaffeensis str. Arkansas]